MMEKSVIDQFIIGRVEPQIYAFSTETVPNYLKVGDTYRPIEQRLQEWRRYFPDLKEHYEAVAKVGKETYFRDFAIHYFLEHDRQLHRLMPTELTNLPYYSREFFRHATEKDVADAIEDIRHDYESNKGKYQFYTFENRPTAIVYTYKREAGPYLLRPNQEEAVKNYIRAVHHGRTNLLMYAVMRFGKTFTALMCAKADRQCQTILVVSGKADVKQEWKKTVESLKNFEGFDFIDTEALARDRDIVENTLDRGHRAVVFLTLQDLSGQQIKRRHQEIFNRTWDLLIIDETHYGARAEEYGKVLRLSKDEEKAEAKYNETAEDYDNNKEMKRLRAAVRLHLSGTPYRILMSSEFQKDDIIAFYQFTDIVRDKEQWDAQHLHEDDVNEWDNPYFGFPQMVRFAFNVNESSMRKMELLKKDGVEYALNELFRPQSTQKTEDGKHLKFRHEKEVLELLMAIDGSKEDANIFSFLNYDRIKRGKLCRHIVCVLPYRASCDAMETLIATHKDQFKNFSQYVLLNIAGVAHEDSYPSNVDVTNKITACEANDQKTLTLTVNRMLTGATVPEWDTMIYLKDTASPQEYDQAVFRLQNQYVREMTDGKGHSIKYCMKPQTLLVDFEPGRMFRMQEAKSQIYNVNTDKRGNSKLADRIAEELRISPIIVVNKDKMKQVEPNDILEEVRAYTANKSIKEEATEIPADDSLLDQADVLEALKSVEPIDSDKGLLAPTYKGEGDDFDVEASYDPTKEKQSPEETTDKKKATEEQKKWLEQQKKLKSYYALILFFAFLTDNKVDSLEDILRAIEASADNQRIARNLKLDTKVLQTIQHKSNPFVLRELDYKISNMSQLACDKSLAPVERAEHAMKKLGKFSKSEIVTPSWMAEEMARNLPENKIQQDTPILDIAAKQGEFASALYKVYGDKIKNSVYSLTTSTFAYEFTRKVYSLLGMPVGNVIGNYNSYDLIKNEKKEKLMQILQDIHPTIVIGNPPYQNEAVGEQKTYNEPIYNQFMDLSYDLSGVVEMIHPARFLSNAGSTPKAWNQKMLADPHLKIVDYRQLSSKVFTGTDIKGGVAVSLRNIDVEHTPVGIFTPYAELNAIMEKVSARRDFIPMSNIVVSRTAYRFTHLMHEEHPEALAQLSEGHPYDVSTNIFERLPQIFFDEKPADGKEYIRILGRTDNNRIYKYVRRDYIRPVSNLDYYKAFLSKANGTGEFGEILTAPFVGEPGTGNTETFISIGQLGSRYEAEALVKYIKTRFVRSLLGALKTTQDITPEKWQYVPLQNFTPMSDIDWTLTVDDIDEQLYTKYTLTADERDFIRREVRKME
jgi:superfamily II DNA or RNA helicase